MPRGAKLDENQLTTIKNLITEGVTYSDIGYRFGITRSAISGIAARKGWGLGVKQSNRPKVPARPGEPAPVAMPPKPKFQMLPDEPPPAPKPQPWPEAQKQATQPPAWAPPPLAPAAPELPPIEPAGKSVLLLDLREQHCRWPVNDGAPFRFCGSRKAPKSSYCEHHHRLSLPKASERSAAYTPPKVSAYKFRTLG